MKKSLCLAAMTFVMLGSCDDRSRLPAGAENEPVNARCLAAFGEAQWGSGPIWSEKRAWASFICTTPIPDHPDLLMIVAFYSPPAEGQPIMQLRVGVPAQGTDYIPLELDPFVFCDLTEDQMNEVLKNGIPRPLSNAMASKVKQYDFKPLNPSGEMTFRIDPCGFFDCK